MLEFAMWGVSFSPLRRCLFGGVARFARHPPPPPKRNFACQSLTLRHHKGVFNCTHSANIKQTCFLPSLNRNFEFLILNFEFYKVSLHPKK